MELDERLVAKALGGDRSAFQQVVEETWGVLFLFIRQRVNDTHLARDLTQDTLLQAYEKRGTVRRGSSFVGWLLTIAANKVIDQRRRKSARPETPVAPAELPTPVAPGSDPTRGIEHEEERVQLEQALARLDDPYRTVLILRYWSGMTPAQIARLLEEPEGTIRNRIFRAHARLRGFLEKSDPTPADDRAAAGGP